METRSQSRVHFADRLIQAVRLRANPVIVGIDPRAEELPAGFLSRFTRDRAGMTEALRVFGCGVVDAVSGLVPGVKFQLAFYELYGPEGLAALHGTVGHAQRSGLVVILDGKRNDIGSTAEAYARAYLGNVSVGDHRESVWEADALTVNPYLGFDGIAPFLTVAEQEGKGVFVLVRTSNPSAGEFQDLISEGLPVYRHVAERLKNWGEGHRGVRGYSLAGAVVGATYPEQLAELRAAMPGVLFLVPGFGTQGASAADVASAFDDQGLGAVINSSRGLTFAYNRPEFARFGDDWQGAIQEATRQMIDLLAQETPAGRLRNEPNT
ncbi:MAG: orotidine-5'-phosphate decarboxylase [Isosphaeraceae bacterium]